jgi:hypothetical protein
VRHQGHNGQGAAAGALNIRPHRRRPWRHRDRAAQISVTSQATSSFKVRGWAYPQAWQTISDRVAVLALPCAVATAPVATLVS